MMSLKVREWRSSPTLVGALHSAIIFDSSNYLSTECNAQPQPRFEGAIAPTFTHINKWAIITHNSPIDVPMEHLYPVRAVLLEGDRYTGSF